MQYLCAKGTADDTIWPMVTSKLDVLSKAGLTKESLSNANMVNFESSKADQMKLDGLFKELMEEDSGLDMTPNETTTSTTLPSLPPPQPTTSLIKISNKATPSLAQAKIDELLQGVDLSKFDSPPMKKIKKSNLSKL